MKEIILKCQGRGKAVGTFADTIENAFKCMNYRVNYIVYSVVMSCSKKNAKA